jgi:hypothetical protein
MRFDEWQDSNGVPVLDGTDLSIPSSALPAGTILQVVQGSKVDTQTLTSISAGGTAALTGLSASITPSSASSKVLVAYSISIGVANGGNGANIILRRDSAAIAVGNASGSRTRVTSGGGIQSGTSDPRHMGQGVMQFLDLPATTSSVTYDFLLQNARNNSETHHINRSGLDDDIAPSPRGISTITLMEVAG